MSQTVGAATRTAPLPSHGRQTIALAREAMLEAVDVLIDAGWTDEQIRSEVDLDLRVSRAEAYPREETL